MITVHLHPEALNKVPLQMFSKDIFGVVTVKTVQTRKTRLNVLGLKANLTKLYVGKCMTVKETWSLQSHHEKCLADFWLDMTKLTS